MNSNLIKENSKKTSICRVCQSEAHYIFSGQLLEHKVDYFQCPDCSYLETENPYWLEQAYSQTINVSDTGILLRNQANSRISLSVLFLLNKLQGNLVDCAGGYGILVRILRDYGVNAFWSDPYCENLVARGFEYENQQVDLATAFEAFEHFVEPSKELDRLLSIASNIFFSTEVISKSAPLPEEWWYYGQEHGQHIGFFTIKTLRFLAASRGKYLTTDGKTYHLISDKPINPMLWKLMIRISRAIPLLLSWILKSKVWSDHALMRNKT